MNRNYVVICNRHKGIAGSLLFWGEYTEDDKERSFGGYTSNINQCEKYTFEELQARKDYNFPVYKGNSKEKEWRKFDDFIIRIDQLKELGFRPITIYYR